MLPPAPRRDPLERAPARRQGHPPGDRPATVRESPRLTDVRRAVPELLPKQPQVVEPQPHVRRRPPKEHLHPRAALRQVVRRPELAVYPASARQGGRRARRAQQLARRVRLDERRRGRLPRELRHREPRDRHVLQRGGRRIHQQVESERGGTADGVLPRPRQGRVALPESPAKLDPAVRRRTLRTRLEPPIGERAGRADVGRHPGSLDGTIPIALRPRRSNLQRGGRRIPPRRRACQNRGQQQPSGAPPGSHRPPPARVRANR